jgi:hypothetical protein
MKMHEWCQEIECVKPFEEQTKKAEQGLRTLHIPMCMSLFSFSPLLPHHYLSLGSHFFTYSQEGN